MTNPEEIEWYTPQEVASLFRVDPKTIGRWEKDGRLTKWKIRVTRTPGKHRRYHKQDIDRVFESLMKGEDVGSI